jgi:hypothetical protein
MSSGRLAAAGLPTSLASSSKKPSTKKRARRPRTLAALEPHPSRPPFERACGELNLNGINSIEDLIANRNPPSGKSSPPTPRRIGLPLGNAPGSGPWRSPVFCATTPGRGYLFQVSRAHPRHFRAIREHSRSKPGQMVFSPTPQPLSLASTPRSARRGLFRSGQRSPDRSPTALCRSAFRLDSRPERVGEIAFKDASA